MSLSGTPSTHALLVHSTDYSALVTTWPPRPSLLERVVGVGAVLGAVPGARWSTEERVRSKGEHREQGGAEAR